MVTGDKVMKTKILTLILCSSLFLIGCSKKDSGGGFSGPRDRYRDQQTNVNDPIFGSDGLGFQACSGSGSWSGTIFAPSFQNEFQSTVEAFATAMGDPSTFLGSVDGRCGSETGMAFHGTIETQQGFDRNGNNSADITQSSRISLAIIDSVAAQGDDLPISIDAFDGAFGYVDGNYAVIEVEWERGRIIFDGNIDYNSQLFIGQASFENYHHFADEDPYSGTFGDFEVPLCSFFKCR